MSCHLPLARTIVTALAVGALLALALIIRSDTGYAGVSTLTVNSTEDTDDGSCDPLTTGTDCTLREAINLLTDNDRIEFAIPALTDLGCNGSGLCVIETATGFPTITEDSVVIDGYTQPGASPNTLAVGNDAEIKIEIRFTGASGTLFTVDGPHFEMSGLALIDLATGVELLGDADFGWIHGNFIGVDTSGSGANNQASSHGVLLKEGVVEVTVGGDDVADRNVISGMQEGVWLLLAYSSDVINNYIGTNPAGTMAIGNSTGVVAYDPSYDLHIGGDTTARRNVISGNGTGVNFDSTSTSILGNYIGLRADGTSAIPNGIGVKTYGGDNARIGNSYAGAGNVISGNDDAGIIASSATNLQILGNYIGTNPAGTSAIPNRVGVEFDSVPGALIGGGQQEARNVISGNTDYGIEAGSYVPDRRILRNYIGTNAAGTGAIPNGLGIMLDSGDIDVFLNLISGNTEAGVAITSDGDGARIRSNFIGADKNGNANLGNGGPGVVAYLGATDVVVGGTSGVDANLIVDNLVGVLIGPPEPSKMSGEQPGVTPQGSSPGPASVAVLRNAIAVNDTLGIDIVPVVGHNDNDSGDGDTGSNSLQNAPVLTSAISGSTLVSGTLDSTPNRDFRFEIFSSSNCDSSGYGEGLSYKGAALLHTDGDGAIEYTVSSGASTQVGDVVTATVTDLTTNETSEFSNCVPVESASSPSPTSLGETPTPTPVIADTPEPSAQITDEPTPVATPTPTPTATPTAGPSGTPTATPTPGPSGSGTPGPSGSPTPTTGITETPTATGGETLIWGDDNCSGAADPVDALLSLRHDAGLSTNTGTCPAMGEEVDVAGFSPHLWGDIDCSDAVDPVDALKLLRYDAALSISQGQDCPAVGSSVVVS